MTGNAELVTGSAEALATEPAGDPAVVLLDPASFTPYYDAALAGALARAGWTVDWVTSCWEFDAVPAPDGVTLQHAFFAALQRGPLSRLVAGRVRAPVRRLLKGLLYPLDTVRLRRALRRRAPGILHVQWAHLPWLDARLWRDLRRAGWRVAYTIHDVDPLEGSSPGPLRWRARALGEAADAIVVHDEAARDSLVGRGVAAARVHVITPGTAAAPERPPTRQAARAALGIPCDAPVVLFLGFVKPYKGLDVLLQSVARLRAELPGIVLLVAGQAMGERTAYDRAIAQLELAATVRWSGAFVPRQALATHLAAADVVALPYLEASSSGVLLEAYAHGRPVVATRVGGLPALVDDGRTGLLVPPRDPAAMASALHELLGDPVRSARMGHDARRRARERHDWASAAAAHAALYRTLWTRPRDVD